MQRISVDRVLLRATSEGPPTGQRVVASALVALVQALAEDAPVLVAIDDAQWLDQCSLAVLTFAARRFKRRVGLLVTERLDAAIGERILAAARSSRRRGPHAYRTTEPRQSPHPDLRSTRPIPFPSHHDAHSRVFWRKSLLRIGTRQSSGCSVDRVRLGATHLACRTHALPHRTAWTNKPGTYCLPPRVSPTRRSSSLPRRPTTPSHASPIYSTRPRVTESSKSTATECDSLTHCSPEASSPSRDPVDGERSTARSPTPLPCPS